MERLNSAVSIYVIKQRRQVENWFSSTLQPRFKIMRTWPTTTGLVRTRVTDKNDLFTCYKITIREWRHSNGSCAPAVFVLAKDVVNNAFGRRGGVFRRVVSRELRNAEGHACFEIPVWLFFFVLFPVSYYRREPWPRARPPPARERVVRRRQRRRAVSKWRFRACFRCRTPSSRRHCNARVNARTPPPSGRTRNGNGPSRVSFKTPD